MTTISRLLRAALAWLLPWALGASAGAVGAYLALDQVSRADRAQQAILYEYVMLYCGRPDEARAQFFAGGMAAMSRAAIRAGLGELALTESQRCLVRGGALTNIWGDP